MTRSRGGTPGSRAVHRLQAWSAHAAATWLAAAASFVVIGAAVFTRRGNSLLIWFEGAAAGVTLVMVFVLQHTQTSQQLALQRKLDELLRALPGTDERLIQVETEPPAVIEEIAKPEGPGNHPDSERHEPTRR